MQCQGSVVLVVDDDAGNRELLQELLQSEGYAVKTAATGCDGLSRIAAGDIDLVLLDRRLPDCDGAELCERVRRRESDTRVPIIMLTAVAGNVQGDAEPPCADDYLAKPFDIDELLDRVRTHLAGSGGLSS